MINFYFIKKSFLRIDPLFLIIKTLYYLLVCWLLLFQQTMFHVIQIDAITIFTIVVFTFSHQTCFHWFHIFRISASLFLSIILLRFILNGLCLMKNVLFFVVEQFLFFLWFLFVYKYDFTWFYFWFLLDLFLYLSELR